MWNFSISENLLNSPATPFQSVHVERMQVIPPSFLQTLFHILRLDCSTCTYCRIIFTILFRASNHQINIIGKENKIELAF